MAIVVVLGPTGHGKGLFSMQVLEEAVLSGRPVYTNYELLPGCPYVDRVARIDDDGGNWPVYRGKPPRDGKKPSDDYMAFWHYTVPGSVVIIDEADTYFDCSDHSDMGHDIRRFHKQHRKLGLDLIYIVQNCENLYVRIRRLTQRFVICEWNFRSFRFMQTLAGWIGVDRVKRMSRFLRSEFGSDSFSPSSHLCDGFLSYREAEEKYFQKAWYRTEQLIGDTSHLQYMKYARNNGKP